MTQERIEIPESNPDEAVETQAPPRRDSDFMPVRLAVYGAPGNGGGGVEISRNLNIREDTNDIEGDKES